MQSQMCQVFVTRGSIFYVPWLHMTQFSLLPGFCWVLHCRSCNDILVLPFSWWYGVCK